MNSFSQKPGKDKKHGEAGEHEPEDAGGVGSQFLDLSLWVCTKTMVDPDKGDERNQGQGSDQAPEEWSAPRDDDFVDEVDNSCREREFEKSEHHDLKGRSA